MIFNVTYYSELHIPIYFSINVIIYQVKMLMLYDVQTTNSTFVGKKIGVQYRKYSIA